MDDDQKSAAEMRILDRRMIVIHADKWDELMEWMNAPAKSIPALQKLAKMKAVWED